jgi:hypothetical protein
MRWIGARADGKLQGVCRELLRLRMQKGCQTVQYSTSAERGFLKKNCGLSDTRNPGARPIAVGVVSQGLPRATLDAQSYTTALAWCGGGAIERPFGTDRQICVAGVAIE